TIFRNKIYTCSHKKYKYHCIICNPKKINYYEIFKKRKELSINKNKNYKCQHEKYKYDCRTCYPKIVSPHEIFTKYCKLCNTNFKLKNSKRRNGQPSTYGNKRYEC